MKTAGVVIDTWKLPIFRRHLDAADYAYTEHPGPTTGTLTLRVQYEWVANLKPDQRPRILGGQPIRLGGGVQLRGFPQMTRHADIHAALDAMRHQHPTSVTTVGPCWRCRQPARGNGPCKHCLAVELATAWKVPADLVDSLMDAHEKARQAIAYLEDVRELVVKAAGG